MDFGLTYDMGDQSRDQEEGGGRDIFSRLYDKKSYTGMYAERFVPKDPRSEEEQVAHAFELRPSMNSRIQARERLATSPRGKKPTLPKNASVC